ncbi:acyl-CoA thioester hydrolase/BAAT C-terminal domain-containing protein [Luteipulveratus flavus]|uniref:Acyl-CoA thioester hydrolase/BAAT C-terminal domain-containing protein n=1 Tax=Luteipulveratus flavus TaxID=3031728 RepID=A0ABT6CBH1_9MICO|nr:acyl-CoA thioester hydrolase/BAAT C-terminal domain-containing protein [Luteipulveratus sp. YIM 133296]MDF8266234.1 acyl-CoA thioester hydrolase/BAAT C-terminal domain-containing protein [Luteipulveratus sp. YIM 133296]
MDQVLTHPEGVLIEPERPCGTGVLVLAGSSGRVDEGRARLLAAHGATAVSIRWFGGAGQSPGPYDVPLETFTETLDVLAGRCDRLAMIGTSFGAEATLLTAVRDPRLSAVVAFAPSPVAWAGIREDGSETSHWTWRGEPLPYVPFVTPSRPAGDPPAFRRTYAESLAAAPAEVVAAATIPVEDIDAETVLVTGGDDRVWPADQWAPQIAARRTAAGRPTAVVSSPAAGHRTVLPGEAFVSAGASIARVLGLRQEGAGPDARAEQV